jgi:hypothetical protein
MTRTRARISSALPSTIAIAFAMIEQSAVAAPPEGPPPPAASAPVTSAPPPSAAPTPSAPPPAAAAPVATPPAPTPTPTPTPTPPPTTATPGDPAAPTALPLTSTPPPASAPVQQPIGDPFRPGRVADTQGDPFRAGDQWAPYTGERTPANSTTTTVVVTQRELPPLPPPPPPAPPPRSKRFFVSGYGGLSFQLSTTSRRLSILNGFQGGLLLGERLSIGVAYRRLAHRVGPDIRGTNGNRYQLGMMYGGGELGVVIVRHGRFEMGIESLFGMGVGCVNQKIRREGHTETRCIDAVRMFVIEPGAFMHFNLTNWMRLGLDGGYRFVVRESFKPPNDFRLSGPYFGMNLEFGWFKRHST